MPRHRANLKISRDSAKFICRMQSFFSHGLVPGVVIDARTLGMAIQNALEVSPRRYLESSLKSSPEKIQIRNSWLRQLPWVKQGQAVCPSISRRHRGLPHALSMGAKLLHYPAIFISSSRLIPPLGLVGRHPVRWQVAASHSSPGALPSMSFLSQPLVQDSHDAYAPSPLNLGAPPSHGGVPSLAMFKAGACRGLSANLISDAMTLRGPPAGEDTTKGMMFPS